MPLKSEEEVLAANTVNLPDFCRRVGIPIKRSGKEYKIRDHSVSINDNPPGREGKWYRFSNDKGGDNISFVMEFLNKSFPEAVDMLNDGRFFARTQNTTPLSVQKHEQPKPIKNTDIHIDEASDKKCAVAYLCKTRGIDYSVIEPHLKDGSITQENDTRNVVFRYRDEQGRTVGAEKVGTSTERRFKGISSGSAQDRGFEIVSGKGEKALFFESAIDALSFQQLYQSRLNNHRLVSCMGLKSEVVEGTIARHGIAPQNVVICTDNDEAGNKFAASIIERYPGAKRFTPPSQYKDFNDCLRGITREQSERQKQQSADYKSYNTAYYSSLKREDRYVSTYPKDTARTVMLELKRQKIPFSAVERSGNVIAVTVKMADKDAVLSAMRQTKVQRQETPPLYVRGEQLGAAAKKAAQALPPQQHVQAMRKQECI